MTYPPPPTGRRSLGRSSVGVTPTFGGWWSEMADIPYGRDYPDPIWCDEDGQPMPPVGAELLDDIRAFLRRFVVYPSDHELIAHTLWIAHCWFMEAWDSTPRIAFLSPEPGSGKSRALEVTEPLVPRPVHAINCTPAYLFRRVADPVGRPTVLYDECDTLFGPKAKEHEEIRGVINAGHRKGAVAGRCVIRGKIVETEELPAYCAVALAGLDDLPDTIMSRSIVVRMRRRAPTEPVEPWRPRVNGPEAEKLHDRLANWAAAINPLESGWPAMPDGVTDRRADVWESLVAVADTAGGHWPKTARATAETDATANRGAKPSIGVLLLRDIRRVFSDRDRMRTSDILTGLNRMEEGPWGSIRRGDPLDARGLATRLGRYGIGPKFQHSGGEPPYKGYSRTQFEDAWSRYLSADDETPEERDLSVSAVSAVSPPVGDPGDATGATDATDLPVAVVVVAVCAAELFGPGDDRGGDRAWLPNGTGRATPGIRFRQVRGGRRATRRGGTGGGGHCAAGGGCIGTVGGAVLLVDLRQSAAAPRRQRSRRGATPAARAAAGARAHLRHAPAAWRHLA